MRSRRGWLICVALLCAGMLLASCGQSQDSGEDVLTEVKMIDKGEIVHKAGDVWLITAYAEKPDGAYIDAYSFTVTEQTVLENADGEAIAADDFKVGAQVDVWGTGGPVRETYPAQADAARIRLSGADGGRSTAVRAALEAQAEAGPWAVKSASPDANQGYWTVELVRHEAMDQPVAVRVDAQSGEALPAVVAENDVFRVFAPAPGTEAEPGFTVEGEARVFEAAFSWQLEDGHYMLAEGHAMADGGAPAWGRFKFDVVYESASQPNMMLILFVHSAKDGSVEHELVIPLKVPEEYIAYPSEGPEEPG